MNEVEWFRRFPTGGGTVYVRPSEASVARRGQVVTPDSPKGPKSAALTEDQQHMLNVAMRAAETGSAGHWPTVAAILHDEVLRLSSEVSRLREQLATAVVLPQDAEDQLRIAIADPGSRLPRIHYTPERASEPVSRWSTRAVLDLLKSWGVSFAEVEAPQPQEWAQHKVVVQPHGSDWWAAKCVECDLVQYSPSKQRSEDWKDQHEADTLRPAVEDAVLFAVAQDRVRRDKGERHTLDDVAQELELMDEGRPSGSERLAPRPVEPFSYQAMLTTLFRRDDGLYVCVCGEQVEECLSHWGGSDWTCKPKWSRDAAQAARSEATPIMCRQDCEAHGAECRCGEPLFHRTCCHTPPSPSLRKEGEDTPPPAVSSQEETKEGETDG